MSDREQDWIAKYRAAMNAELPPRSRGRAIVHAIRRAWQVLRSGFKGSSRDSKMPAAEPKPARLAWNSAGLKPGSVRKSARREAAARDEVRKTKAG